MTSFWSMFWPNLWANFIGGALIVLPALWLEARLDEAREKRHETRERAYFKVARPKRRD